MKQAISKDEAKVPRRKSTANASEHPKVATSQLPVVALQNQVGNRAVQRLLAQRSGDGAFDLDDDTAQRINRQRGGGQSLDSAVQTKLGAAMGQDFSGVHVHTSPESHALNQQLGAKAFTTGQDIYFREGAYAPHTSSGQELIAHELTHVVQQGSGAVGSAGRMKVNAPGDQFEQEADAVAKTVASSDATPAVQRQEEEEEIQTKRIQRQEEEEEAVQMQEEEEEEVQMQELPEEEEELA